MDSKKILAICVVIVVVAASAGIAFAVLNKGDNPTLKVSYLKKNGYETLMVAEDKGFFGQAGLSVESIAVTGSGQDAVNALLAGQVDIAATGHGPVANTLNTYLDKTVIICGVNHSTGGQVWVSKTGTGIVPYDGTNKEAVKTSFDTFLSEKGRPVYLGVQKGATTESEIKLWLKTMDVQFADFDASTDGKTVKLVDAKKANMLITMMNANEIDVMAASQPFPANALANIKDSYVIGSNADTKSYDLACYITTKAIYDEKKDAIEKFIKGLDIASKYMADSKNTDECIDICTKVIGTERDTVKSAFDIADWKVAWSDAMVDTLYKTCDKKGYSVTKDDCRDKCLFRDFIATL